ncbi:polysaccharide lyase family 7 protein [Shewanella maritima]|uniref:polysaccharide lyase family 7 protein n=1 Tax=Shewanella maritima TaxID=2520507 RepID=UPI0037355680
MNKTSKLSLALLCSALLFGCASTEPTIPSAYQAKPLTGEKVAVTQYSKFDSIAKVSKLQISEPNAKPGSKYELAKDGDFSDVLNEYFYVDTNAEALVMKMTGYKLRNEFRVQNNFKTDDANAFYRLSADVMPINPRESMKDSPSKNDAFTILQVHNKGTFDDGKHGVGYIPHPLMRIVYEAERRDFSDHYWAVIKNNNINCSTKSGNRDTADCKNAYIRVNLGKYDPDHPTRFDILVGDKRLIVKVDGVTRVDHNIDYWQDFLSYFKAGVYNQFENGTSEAHFYSLEYAKETAQSPYLVAPAK